MFDFEVIYEQRITKYVNIEANNVEEALMLFRELDRDGKLELQSDYVEETDPAVIAVRRK